MSFGFLVFLDDGDCAEVLEFAKSNPAKYWAFGIWFSMSVRF